jgi:hypothetical protein
VESESPFLVFFCLSFGLDDNGASLEEGSGKGGNEAKINTTDFHDETALPTVPNPHQN